MRSELLGTPDIRGTAAETEANKGRQAGWVSAEVSALHIGWGTTCHQVDGWGWGKPQMWLKPQNGTGQEKGVRTWQGPQADSGVSPDRRKGGCRPAEHLTGSALGRC